MEAVFVHRGIAHRCKAFDQTDVAWPSGAFQSSAEHPAIVRWADARFCATSKARTLAVRPPGPSLPERRDACCVSPRDSGLVWSMNWRQAVLEPKEIHAQPPQALARLIRILRHHRVDLDDDITPSFDRASRSAAGQRLGTGSPHRARRPKRDRRRYQGGRYRRYRP